ncbi:hypothetical protein C1646_719422, partial [Rhizophagus diaphanus]
WQFFMWFASLETVENHVCLFILVWDDIPVRISPIFSRELREETDNLIQIIKELNISKENDKNYSKILADYNSYRFLAEQTFRQNLVHDVWAELENHGLKNNSYAVSEQISRCSIFKKKELRAMILSRMKSFQSFSRKIKDAKELKQAPLNNKKNENLKAQVKELIKENSNQQAALGNLTNVFWNDDKSHNSKKLIQGITDLQDMLKDFTMVQGSNYKIINDEANILLRAFRCEVNCPSLRASLVLGFLLQRIAIIKILEEVEKYLNGKFAGSRGMALEGDIANTTETLINQTILFEKNRKGEDDITKITPIKIRQHVYSALSCRGFPSDHSLVTTTASKLLHKMNKYRQIVDKETKSEMDDLAIQITHKIINVFYFSFKTQASVPAYKFFDAGQALEPHLMQGAFVNDESKKLEVEVCGFPCIGIFTGDKLSDRIFIKAQIIPRS